MHASSPGALSALEQSPTEADRGRPFGGGDSGRRSPRGHGGGGCGGGHAGRGDTGLQHWASWVLDNYSLYTCLFVAFVRKSVNMSFKVPAGSDGLGRVGDGGHGGKGGLGDPLRALLDAGTGIANLELLGRIAEVFDDDVMTLILRCQVRLPRRFRGGRCTRMERLTAEDRGGRPVSDSPGPRSSLLEAFFDPFEPIQGVPHPDGRLVRRVPRPPVALSPLVLIV